MDALSEELQTLGAMLRARRQELGLTLRQVVAKQPALSQVENGQLSVTDEYLRNVLSKLQADSGLTRRVLELATAHRDKTRSRRMGKVPGQDRQAEARYLASTFLTADELVELGLQSVFGMDENITSLVNTVIGIRPPYRDVEVECLLEDDPSDGEIYLFTVRQSFTAVLDDYVVAVVPDADLFESVIASCSRVTETWLAGDEEYATLAAEAVIEKHRVAVIERDKGVSKERDVPIEAVPLDEGKAYLNGLSARSHSKIRLFRGRVRDGSDKAQSALSPLRLVTSSTIQMEKAGCYCFWSADRPLFLQRITFDHSRFSYGKTLKFHLHPFMANYVGAIPRQRAGRLEMNINNWLVAGQGVVLIWGERRSYG